MNSTPVVNSTRYTPTSAGEVQELLRSLSKVLPHGARTKQPLLRVADDGAVAQLDMTQVAGIIEYEPGEYTFTAYAGTRLTDIANALAEHGQYLPFDPPLVASGATLGGTIAAGLSGSGRYRYGGLRDFIIGVNMVDGQGRLIRGGGKVVKNAAGFDIPKLMVGSIGRLGVIVSASFKVFPAPASTATLNANFATFVDALNAMARLMGGPYDLEALDLLPQLDGTVKMLVRIGGPADVIATRLDRLRALVGSGEAVMNDASLWTEAREFSWLGHGVQLVKVATTPRTLPQLEIALQEANVVRRYGVGGNLAWIAWPGAAEPCHQMLVAQGMRGLILRGNGSRALIGLPVQNEFLKRVRAALDPYDRFVPFE